MSKVNVFLEEKVMPVAGKIAAQRHLQALRDGIILAMPLIIIGSLFLILGFLPIPGYNEWMASIFGELWLTKLTYPVTATFDIMALVATFGIAYRLAEHYKVDPLSAGAISLSAFVLATPYFTMFTPAGTEAAIEVTGVLPIALLGSKGLFVGILIALLSTEIFRYIVQKGLVIRMPDGVPPSVSKSFIALFPAAIVIIVVWLLRLIIEMTPFESLHNIVGQLLQEPLSVFGTTLVGAIVYVLLVHLLWVCGLHGAAIIGGIMGPIMLSATDENRLALQAGTEIPNIVNMQFFEIFIHMGGSGATLMFAVMMLIFAKSQQSKQLGKLAIGPGIFNINEPIVFGAPIVMNPILMIPFILAPVVMAVSTFVFMQIGFAPKATGIAVPWTTPPIIGGLLATGGDWRGGMMQAINLVIAFAIYYPFFKVWDKQNLQLEKGTENDETSE
jgi:PTS system cellobiose-specific IIC component